MNTKSRLFTLVVEEFDKANNKHILWKDLKKYLDSEDYVNYYAFILHNKDFDDNGEEKRPHFHIVLETIRPYAKGSILTDMAKELLVARECISIRAYDSCKLAVQYLVHKNDQDKAQYDILEVCSSDETRTIDYIDNDIEADDLDIKDLCEICYNAKNIIDVYRTIGINNAKKYRWIIIDLLEQKREDSLYDC